jgi:hypothetical protein
MSEMTPPAAAGTGSWRRRWLIVATTLLIAVAIGGAVLYAYAATLIEQRLRPATIALLEERFDSKVELASMRVSLTPTLSVRGEGLTLRHQGRTDIPPLITIRAFTISSSVRELWARHIDRVHLEGLEIMVPPRRGADMPSLKAAVAPDAARPDRDNRPADVSIHELVTESSLLTILPKREGKRPRVFQLRRIRFEDFQFGAPTPFEAAISNPTPAGEIEAKGRFGPWVAADPSLTPIDGAFVFDADLATIKGIGGALHATGTFSGPLEYIRTSGKTRTEGFHLSSGGTKFPLTVDYDAIVDGTNGDTTLERVVGELGASKITAKGAIVNVEGVRGRRITLDTTTTGGRLEDFVALTTRVPASPLTGTVNVKATLDIPPGEPEVIRRMRLDGTFEVARAKFTSKTIQARVDELSRRGQGRPKDDAIDDVASNLRGSFLMSDARMTLRTLTFSVSGAQVRLTGHYGVESERLDFKGTLRLQAKVSQTQTGWRSILLKVFDPMFDGKGAGTILPITIGGTRDQPKFGVDVKKAILH